MQHYHYLSTIAAVVIVDIQAHTLVFNKGKAARSAFAVLAHRNLSYGIKCERKGSHSANRNLRSTQVQGGNSGLGSGMGHT